MRSYCVLTKISPPINKLMLPRCNTNIIFWAISVVECVVVRVCGMRGCSMLGLCFYFVNRVPLPVKFWHNYIITAQSQQTATLAKLPTYSNP